MIAAFLGAGFSRWAADLPLASELFDFKIRNRNERESRWVEEVRKEWSNWSSRNPQGYVEEFIGTALQFPQVRRRRVIWYITRRLSDPFICELMGGRTATYAVNEKRLAQLPGVIRAQKFLVKILLNSCGIVTSNYDLLVEYALTTRHFNYGMPGEQLYGRGPNYLFPGFGAHPKIAGRLPLAKLHGSLSWDVDKRYTDGRRGLSGEALIIPPHPEKVAPIELKAVWELGEKIISKANMLVVFGFAFNEYDAPLLDLLKLSGRNLSQVLLIDIAPKREIAAALWPNAKILTSRPPNRKVFKLERWFD